MSIGRETCARSGLRLAKCLRLALPCIVMKRLFAIAVLLLAFVVRVHADGADEQYVQIYTLIEEGDSLEATQPAQALAKYTEAQTELQTFQKVYPGWNDRIVNFRLNYLASKIVILSPHNLSAPSAPAVPSVAPQNRVVSEPSPSVVVAPVQPQPVQPRISTTVVASQPVQPSPASYFQDQIADLQNQLNRLQSDKSLLEAKLREALAARPVGADPVEFAKAQSQIRMIQKENELLQVTLSQEREKAAAVANSSELTQAKHELADTKRQLAEQLARADQLTQENASLRFQLKSLSTNDEELASLRAENDTLKALVKKPGAGAPAQDGDTIRQLAGARATIAELESDKEVWRLEKIALQDRVRQLSSQGTVAAAAPVWSGDSEHLKQLERERDELQKKLDVAQKELYGRKAKGTAAQVDELAEELEILRARLDVYESKPVPYTAEELALFKKPDTAVADPHEGEKSVRELPPGTVELVAEAQEDFARKSYEQAEQKYQEILKHDKKNVSTLANLAAIQLEMSHYEDAEKNIKAALAVAPNDAFSLSILGNLRFRQGRYDDALDALSRAAKLDPRNAEIQNFLGLTLSEKGMRSAAETAFRKAIILNPNYGGAQNNLAVFYLTQKPPSLELARWHYEKAIATGFPRNPDLEKLLNEHPAEDGQ